MKLGRQRVSEIVPPSYIDQVLFHNSYWFEYFISFSGVFTFFHNDSILFYMHVCVCVTCEFRLIIWFNFDLEFSTNLLHYPSRHCVYLQPFQLSEETSKNIIQLVMCHCTAIASKINMLQMKPATELQGYGTKITPLRERCNLQVLQTMTNNFAFGK